MKQLVVLTMLIGSLFFVEASNFSVKEFEKLVDSNGSQDDHFGNSVSIDGDVAVVGSSRDNCLNGVSNCGSAVVYKKDSATGRFVQLAKLMASDGQEEDLFGESVSISGDTVVVGLTRDDDLGTSSGSAYVFVKPLLGWVDANQTAKLKASDGSSYDYFGGSVSIDGDTIVIGADGNSNKGAVYVFEKPISGWVDANETAKLTTSVGSNYCYIGISVSISGDVIVSGAYQDDSPKTAAGSAYVFEKPLSGWVDANQTARLTASDANDSDGLGISVSIDGDTVVAGANGDDDSGSRSGSAYVFVKPLSGWVDATQTAKLKASDGAVDDYFGDSVAVSGDVVVVGAPRDDDKSYSTGSAYMFKKPDSGWTNANESVKITASDAIGGEALGGSVSISGEFTIVGALDADVSASNDGAAYIFKESASFIPSTIMYLLN